MMMMVVVVIYGIICKEVTTFGLTTISALKLKIISGRQSKHTNVVIETGDLQVEDCYLQRGVGDL